MFVLFIGLWNAKQDMVRECQNFNIINEMCVDVCFGLQSETCAKLSKSTKCVLKCVGKCKVRHVRG